MSTTTSKKRAFRIGAGVAALVGLGLAGAGTAQAATGFDPSSADSRIGGSDRYATAALIAQQSWTTASTVIVANGETNGIDALSASYLAGVVDAPILLTQRDAVPAETAEAIAKLNPSKVIVVGGEPSVSASTYASLTAGRTAERIAGADRYETATKIVEAGMKATTTTQAITSVKSVFIARGDLYGNSVAADALAASPVAFRGHVPVLLVEPNAVPASTLSLLKSITPSSVFAIGDTKAVSSATEQALRTELSLPSIGRLQGSDRTETAAAIANSQAAKDAGFTNTAVGIANGYKVDALAAGPAAGKGGYPLLLTESATALGSGTQAYLEANKTTLTSAKVFGDASSVSTTATDAARSSGEGTVTTPPVTTPPVTTPPVTTPPVTSPPTDPPTTTPSTPATAVTLPAVTAGSSSVTASLDGALGLGTLEGAFAASRDGNDLPLDPADYNESDGTITLTLANGEVFALGDKVTVVAKSLTSGLGDEFPEEDEFITVQELPVSASLSSAGDTAKITFIGAPEDAEFIVLEQAGDGEPTNILGDPDRNVEYADGVLSFSKPTAVGKYTYTYLVKGAAGQVLTEVNSVLGSLKIAPVAPTASVSDEGVGNKVVITLGGAVEGDLVVERQEGTGNWIPETYTAGETSSLVEVVRPTAVATWRYRVAVKKNGITSAYQYATGSVVVVPVAPTGATVAEAGPGEALKVSGVTLTDGQELVAQARYSQDNGTSFTPVPSTEISGTEILRPAPGIYQYRFAIQENELTSEWSDWTQDYLVVLEPVDSLVAAKSSGDVVLTTDADVPPEKLLFQVSSSEGRWLDVPNVVDGSDGQFSAALPAEAGVYSYRVIVLGGADESSKPIEAPESIEVEPMD